MYSLRRFHGSRFNRVNAVIDSLEGHISSYVNLIGSATLPLPEVLQMQSLPGSACRVEGYRDSRLFPATEPMDMVETLIEEDVRRLFGVDDTYAVNAQPHSATQANHAVFRAVLGAADGPVVGLSPSDGGHISHRLGIPSSATFVPMPLHEARIDYEALEREAVRVEPKLMVGGGTSYTREVDYARLRSIADLVDCHLHADLAHTAPFVIAGVHSPVFPFADSVTLDPSKNLRGPSGGVLIYRNDKNAEMRRAIFPVLQSAPNQNGMLAKAACLAYWSPATLRPYAERMVRLAQTLGEALEPVVGTPVYGGTDTHLLLFDLSPLSLDGREAEAALERAQVLVNRNQVPGDERPPWAPSGIRLGSTALAILGYDDQDARDLGNAIRSVLEGGEDSDATVKRLVDTYHRPLVSTASGPT